MQLGYILKPKLVGHQTRLLDRTKHVAVEPDALDTNLARNGCLASVHRGFVSKRKLALTKLGVMAVDGGYGATSVPDVSSELPIVTVEELAVTVI